MRSTIEHILLIYDGPIFFHLTFVWKGVSTVYGKWYGSLDPIGTSLTILILSAPGAVQEAMES